MSPSSPAETESKPAGSAHAPAPIWWSNGIFFVGTHIGALYGVLHVSPVWATSYKSLALAFVLWQLSCFGITIGYHRLYSHRAFHATLGVRIVLSILGSMAFQGSIKDLLIPLLSLPSSLKNVIQVSQAQIASYDPVHDPYAATRGLLFSHMGWIFFKPSYERMASIDRSDLEKDPVVKYQHENYIPIALFFGLVAPALMGWTWGDTRGAFVWGGLVARVTTWHCTFLVNSLAHWEGLQKYSDEVSARGNLIMALLTCGEGNHNFHAFPHDFRAGPASLDWDPSKWVIQFLHRLRLATRLRRARDKDIEFAIQSMRRKQKAAVIHETHSSESETWQGPAWTRDEVQKHVTNHREKCFLILDDFLVDATSYLGDHPGGAALLRTWSLRADEDFIWKDADWAFQNLNHHSQMARRRLRELTIAKILSA